MFIARDDAPDHFSLSTSSPPPPPQPSVTSVREQTILFPLGGTRQIREYEKELPPTSPLPHTADGNKSLISAAFLPFRVLRGEERRGEDCERAHTAIHATGADYAPFPVEDTEGAEGVVEGGKQAEWF